MKTKLNLAKIGIKAYRKAYMKKWVKLHPHKKRYASRKKYFKVKNKQRAKKGMFKTNHYKQRERTRRASPNTALMIVEVLLSLMNPNEDDKNLTQLYRVVHSANKFNSCFKVHEDWRQQTIKLAKSLRNLF